MLSPMMESMGVSKRYGRVQALDGVSLRIPAGRVTGLLGPNSRASTARIHSARSTSPPRARGHPDERDLFRADV